MANKSEIDAEQAKESAKGREKERERAGREIERGSER